MWQVAVKILQRMTDTIAKILIHFSCSKNPDVEYFLKNSSVDFTRKNQSVTYLVLDMDDGALVGYFTIALKPMTVRDETVSDTVKRKIKGHFSVSDIVVLHVNRKNSAHFVDSFGFTKLPDFMHELENGKEQDTLGQSDQKQGQAEQEKAEETELAFQITDRYI